MRQSITYKKWIPVVYPPGTNSANQNTPGHYKTEGTGCWESGFSLRGWLHGFGVDSEETQNGIWQRTVAIVESCDNTIELLPVSCIRLIPQKISFT
jgi:hypothetical protein